MKSYKIQHDFLFASNDVAVDGEPHFDVAKSKREECSSLPVKASSLLDEKGEGMLDVFSFAGKPILLIDDLPLDDNPIIMAYRSLLIRGIIAEFHKRERKVFTRTKSGANR